jgi:hypothetical protein
MCQLAARAEKYSFWLTGLSGMALKAACLAPSLLPTCVQAANYPQGQGTVRCTATMSGRESLLVHCMAGTRAGRTIMDRVVLHALHATLSC